MQDYFEKAEHVEARAIMRLVSLGTTTLDPARELISIPEREEQALNLFVAIAGKEGAPIGEQWLSAARSWRSSRSWLL